jgi:hypothetical protein
MHTTRCAAQLPPGFDRRIINKFSIRCKRFIKEGFREGVYLYENTRLRVVNRVIHRQNHVSLWH